MSPEVDRELRDLAKTLRLLATLTPLNAREERDALVSDFERGALRLPVWHYAPRNEARDREFALRLEKLSARVSEHAGEGDLAQVYLDRLEELALEGRLRAACNTPAVSSLAQTRFDADTKEADALSVAWRQDREPTVEEESFATDAPRDDALLTRLRREVGRLRLPYRVQMSAGLSALAATGDGVILVAEHRLTTPSMVDRIVVHELFGHVLPRVRAAALPCAIFRVGTARGTDTQEGLALVYEERAGVLCAQRRRELAFRHEAIRWMHGGANFVDVASRLAKEAGMPWALAVPLAERVFRGSDGSFAGLGRESVYLPAFCDVRRALTDSPDDERVLASGQVALKYVPVLRSIAG